MHIKNQIRNVLSKYISSEVLRINNIWEYIVGSEFADKSSPMRLIYKNQNECTLVIHAEGAVALYIKSMTKEIIFKMNQANICKHISHLLIQQKHPQVR